MNKFSLNQWDGGCDSYESGYGCRQAAEEVAQKEGLPKSVAALNIIDWD